MTCRLRTVPICGFDTETDSPLPEDARIISCCVGIADPHRRSWSPRTWLLQPEREIPAETTAIHGITTDHARAHGQPRTEAVLEIADALDGVWVAGWPVAAFNASFDFTVLDHELGRVGRQPLQIGGLVLDPLIIDKALDKYRKGSRKLQAVAAHHQITLTDRQAHTADADAFTAARLAWILAPGLPADKDLMTWQAQARADQDASYATYLRESGKTVEADLVDTWTGWPVRHPATLMGVA